MALTLDKISFKNEIDYKSLLDIIYPVGSIYISIEDTSPADFLGGKWVKIEGAVLAASGSQYSGVDFGNAGRYDGTATLSTNQLPSHTHSASIDSADGRHNHYVTGTATSAGSHQHKAAPDNYDTLLRYYASGNSTVRHIVNTSSGSYYAFVDTNQGHLAYRNTNLVDSGGEHTHSTYGKAWAGPESPSVYPNTILDSAHKHTITIGNTGNTAVFRPLNYVVNVWKRMKDD